MNQELVGTRQASRILECHNETIRRMVRSGRLKTLGGFHFFVFQRKLIESLPRAKVGRPRKGSSR
jgi:hypothetical protein